MNPEIASIHERMAQGGDWAEFRKEISRLLHDEARTQEEYVTLLEAHRKLMAVAEYCFPPDQCEQLRHIGKGEYLSFLNVEAMEGDQINPRMLNRITKREVESGRMPPDDDFRRFAEDAGSVLGDSADLHYDRKLGDRIGLAGIVLGALAFFFISKSLGIGLFVIGMVTGWFIIDQRRKAAKLDAQRAREAHGYD
jgi:hypothetical protein